MFKPILAAALLAALPLNATHLLAEDPASQPASQPNFTGDHSDWHGFARYDFSLDEKTLAITPLAPNAKPAGRRCIVVAPKNPATGNPWSWRGVYWDHQPQTEIELLKRGFHIAYITADANLKPDKKWDAWYDFLTTQHALAKKPAFVGMSRGGEYSYIWATTHPDKVACIYGDNPGGNPDNLSLLEPLAKNDVPILHVVGSIDPILLKYSTAIENIYQQFGGRISVMTKEGYGHHPHSLNDPKPIADFIEQSVQATLGPKPAAPDWAGKDAKKYYYYSLETQDKEFPSEKTYLDLRGPLFTPCYERYEVFAMGFQVPVNVTCPQKTALGNPWIFRPDYLRRDAVVDQALLAAGFHIVIAPTGYNADGPVKEDWDKVYQYLTAHGFSKKPVMEGAGGASGEAFAWAIENPDKVSAIYAENPLFRSHMSKKQPLDNLDPLAKANIPILIAAGSLDPALKDQATVLEKRYKDLSGTITLLITETQGHFPTAPKDPQPAIDFILKSQESAKP